MSSDEKKCSVCNKTEAELTDNLKNCARCKKVQYCSRDCQAADWKSHKKACAASKPDQAAPISQSPTTTASRPTTPTSVLILAVDDSSVQTHAKPLLQKIERKTSLQYATTAEHALELIGTSNSSTAIFVIDASPTMKKYKQVSNKMVQFVQGGGTVVLGGSFSSFVRPNSLSTYFNKAWGLPWKTGMYQRTTVSLNPNAVIGPRSSLIPAYSQKALFLVNVEAESAWNRPTETSVTESHVFAPTPISDLTETPVAFVKRGRGWLGYVGDVNAENGTDNVVLGMLGLL